MAALANLDKIEEKTFYNKICCFDTETTALATDKAKVIEISLRDISGKNVYTRFVDPVEKINNSHIHHITNDLIKQNNGQTFDAIIPEIELWVNDVFGNNNIVYMLAHNNIYYDKMVLESEYARHGLKIPSNWLFIDSYQQIREVYPKLGRGNYKLINLYKKCAQKPLENAHRAEADTHALVVVYNNMILDKFNHNIYNVLQNGPFIEKSVFSHDYVSQELRYMPYGLFRSEINKLQNNNIFTLEDVVNLCVQSNQDPNILVTKLKLAKFSANKLMRKVQHFLRIMA